MSYRYSSTNSSRRERSRERESSSYNNSYRDNNLSRDNNTTSRGDYSQNPRRYNNTNDHEIPKSRHSIQIKGLSGHVKPYEVENFLEKKVGGPLKTVFFKPDIKHDEVFIAIRFDDKEKAKICCNTLHKTLMLGSTVFIDYYQDLGRHNEYIERKQLIVVDDYRPSRGRSRERSPIRNRSPPPRPNFSSRSDDFNTETSPPEYRYDRSKRHDNEVVGESIELNRRTPLLPKPLPAVPMESSFTGMQMDGFPNTSISSHRSIAPAPYPIAGPLHSNNRLSNIPPPGFSSVLPIAKEHSRFSKFSSTNFPDIRPSSTEPKTETWRTPDPDTFSAARLNAVQILKYQPQEKKNDIQGRFRLGAVSVEASKNEMRKEKFLRLSPQARLKVEEKKQDLLKAYQDDCNTYGFLTQSLINKNPSLEESLRVALAEVLKDLEENYKQTLDDFIEILIE